MRNTRAKNINIQVYANFSKIMWNSNNKNIYVYHSVYHYKLIFTFIFKSMLLKLCVFLQLIFRNITHIVSFSHMKYRTAELY